MLSLHGHYRGPSCVNRVLYHPFPMSYQPIGKQRGLFILAVLDGKCGRLFSRLRFDACLCAAADASEKKKKLVESVQVCSILFSRQLKRKTLGFTWA